MKKWIFIFVVLACACSSKTDILPHTLNMAVISDLHLMAPSLLKADGPALEAYIENDRKLLREGPQLLKETVEILLAQAPEVVLISGDLTKDGETVSHIYLRDNFLAPLRDAGIRVFVVPGNHDIRNPHAVEFNGAATTRVPTPSAEEFSQIYADYGYGEAIARDSHSLSYTAQINPHTRLICIDANRYEENSFEENTCITPGRIKKQTLSFIRDQMRQARKDGMRLIAMMHHGAVPHWKYQNLVMGDYVVDNWRKLSRMFRRGGVDLIFTGHFHSHDITARKGLTDVETGSLLSYPAPLRFVSLTEKEARISSVMLTGKYLDFKSYGEFEQIMLEYADGAMRGVVDQMIPDDVSPEVKECCCAILSRAYTAHLMGDEQASEADLAELTATVRALRRESLLYSILLNRVASSFWTDLPPSDHTLILPL